MMAADYTAECDGMGNMTALNDDSTDGGGMVTIDEVCLEQRQ